MSGGGEAMLYPYRPAGEHRLPGLRPGCAAGPGALLGLMRDVGVVVIKPTAGNNG